MKSKMKALRMKMEPVVRVVATRNESTEAAVPVWIYIPHGVCIGFFGLGRSFGFGLGLCLFGKVGPDGVGECPAFVEFFNGWIMDFLGVELVKELLFEG